MNKLIILSLAALVACALAGPVEDREVTYNSDEVSEKTYSSDELESQLALFESDLEEAKGVKMQEFTEFCKASRDRSRVYLEDKLNQAALKVYNAIFKSIEQISIDAIAAGAAQVENGRKVILNEETAMKIANDLREEDVMEPISIDGEEQVVEEPEPQSLSWRFFGSLTRAFKAFLQLVADETWAHIAKVREELKGENFKVVFNEACQQITRELAPILREEFKNEKSELRQAMTDANSKMELNAVTFENVNCVTTRRVVLASRLCHGVERIGPIFYPFLDLFLEPKAPQPSQAVESV